MAYKDEHPELAAQIEMAISPGFRITVVDAEEIIGFLREHQAEQGIDIDILNRLQTAVAMTKAANQE